MQSGRLINKGAIKKRKKFKENLLDKKIKLVKILICLVT